MKSYHVSLSLVLLLLSTSIQAQHKGRGARVHPHHPRVVVKRSVYRPAKVVVFHPRWHPNRACYRRWVYFPKHNLYWDNWRNQYVFWNGSLWITQSAAPPTIININLQNEKSFELSENEDDQDEIYAANVTHKKEYQNK